jgi:hypothetical protein
MTNQNTQTLQSHLRWALNELDRYVTIGGDGIARNHCEGRVVEDYVQAYSAARKSLQPPELKIGSRVWINFPADTGLDNGYSGEATLLEHDNSEALFTGEMWRVSIPGGDDECWFPANSMTPLL